MSSGGRSWRYLNLARRIDFGDLRGFVYGLFLTGTSSAISPPVTAIYGTKGYSRRTGLPVDQSSYFFSKYPEATNGRLQLDTDVYDAYTTTKSNDKFPVKRICKGHRKSDDGNEINYTSNPMYWNPATNIERGTANATGAYVVYLGAQYNFLDCDEVLDVQVKNKLVYMLVGSIKRTILVDGTFVKLYVAAQGQNNAIEILSINSNSKVDVSASADGFGATVAYVKTGIQEDYAGSSIVDAKIKPDCSEVSIIACYYGMQTGATSLTDNTKEMVFNQFDLSIGIEVNTNIGVKSKHYVVAQGSTISSFDGLRASYKDSRQYNMDMVQDVQRTIPNIPKITYVPHQQFHGDLIPGPYYKLIEPDNTFISSNGGIYGEGRIYVADLTTSLISSLDAKLAIANGGGLPEYGLPPREYIAIGIAGSGMYSSLSSVLQYLSQGNGDPGAEIVHSGLGPFTTGPGPLASRYNPIQILSADTSQGPTPPTIVTTERNGTTGRGTYTTHTGNNTFIYSDLFINPFIEYSVSGTLSMKYNLYDLYADGGTQFIGTTIADAGLTSFLGYIWATETKLGIDKVQTKGNLAIDVSGSNGANSFFIAGVSYINDKQSLGYGNKKYVYFGIKPEGAGSAIHTNVDINGVRYTWYPGTLSNPVGYTYKLSDVQAVNTVYQQAGAAAGDDTASIHAANTSSPKMTAGYYLGDTFTTAILLCKSGLQLNPSPLGQWYSVELNIGKGQRNYYSGQHYPTASDPIRYSFPARSLSPISESYSMQGDYIPQQVWNAYNFSTLANASGVLAISGDINTDLMFSSQLIMGYKYRAENKIDKPDQYPDGYVLLHKDFILSIEFILNGVTTTVFSKTVPDVEEAIEYIPTGQDFGFFIEFGLSSYNLPTGPYTKDIYYSALPYSGKADHCFRYEVAPGVFLVAYSSFILTNDSVSLAQFLADVPLSLLRLETIDGSIIADIGSVLTEAGQVGILQDRTKMFIAGAAH